MGDTPVRQGRFAEMIHRALRDQYDAVLTEQLPKRWVDLINRLSQREGQAQQRKAEPDQKPAAGSPESACPSAMNGPKR
jgi:hypothetical protein